MNMKQRDRLVRAIRNYVRAVNDDSWKGSGDPDDIPEIEQRLITARKALTRALDDAMDKPSDQYHGN